MDRNSSPLKAGRKQNQIGLVRPHPFGEGAVVGKPAANELLAWINGPVFINAAFVRDAERAGISRRKTSTPRTLIFSQPSQQAVQSPHDLAKNGVDERSFNPSPAVRSRDRRNAAGRAGPRGGPGRRARSAVSGATRATVTLWLPTLVSSRISEPSCSTTSTRASKLNPGAPSPSARCSGRTPMITGLPPRRRAHAHRPR